MIAIVFFASYSSAYAQSATGAIQGHVFDSSGAGVPGASVKIQNRKTGVRQTTSTNQQGNFCSRT